MFKLIIVDDEKMTRESLRTYIEWVSLGVGSVRVARNGVEALSLAGDEPPDLVLTDVRMPKMDGIALAERLRESLPHCRVIFLSGYADKQYLKRAIQLRAVDYVEKPVQREILQAAVAAAVDELRGLSVNTSVARIHIVAEPLEGAVPTSEPPMRTATAPTVAPAVQDETGDLCRRLVGVDTLVRNPVFTNSAYEPLRPQLDARTTFTVCVLSVERAPRGEDVSPSVYRAGVEGERSGAEAIAAVCRGVDPFSDPAVLCGWCEQHNGADYVAFVLTGRALLRGPGVENNLRTLAQRLEAQSPVRVTVRFGLGVPVRGVASVPVSYRSARDSLSQAFYDPGRTVCFPAERGIERLEVDDCFVSLFRARLRDLDREGCEETLGRLRDAASFQQPLSVDSVLAVYRRLTHIIAEEARRARGPEDTTIPSPQDFLRSHDINGVGELAARLMARYFAGAPGSRTVPRNVREARRFIQQNFRDPGLSLQRIADHVGLTRSYLSALFKTATGSNLSEYVTTLRIEHAKELLLDVSARTYEVAEHVGYTDANYFSSLFRRVVGSSPSEFREKSGYPA